MDKNWQEIMRTLSDSAQYLFNNQEMSDVKFIFNKSDSEPEVIYAHSWLLSIMSSVFYNSFKNNFEVSKEIPITDYSFEVFIEFLRFLYTAKCHITNGNVFEIMEVAKKYSLKFLVEDCANYIVANCITNESACETLIKANTIRHKDLKDKVISFIGQNIREVFQTKGFLNIDNEALRSILIIDETGPITEIEVFTAVMKWATHKCFSNQMEINGENKRFQLDDLVKLIRFPIMTSEEFGTCMKKENGLLTSEEKYSLLLSISTAEMNKLGFVDQCRKHSIYLNETKETQLKIFNENAPWEYKKMLNGKSKFTVNKTIFLTQVSVGEAEADFETVSIQLLDDTITIINQQTFLVDKDKFANKWLNFTEPLLIDSNREYILNINYKNKNSNFFCVEKKMFFPWSRLANEVQFKFTELSELLFGIKFKHF